jgi:hypothetical protein
MINRDLTALSLLLTQHINPYGCLELDLEAKESQLRRLSSLFDSDLQLVVRMLGYLLQMPYYYSITQSSII